MSRLRSKAHRKRLLRGVRRRRVKYITVLPSLITLLNAVFGFTAIVFASRGADQGIAGFSYFAMAGYMILLAMFADMLDGRLARMSQSTSSFGGQLDSLCDLVSFGVAPAFIMLKVMEARSDLATPLSGDLFHRFIWLAALAYVSCAIIRLARFNVENEESETAHMSFTGLPTPGAAGAIASLVIFHQEVVVPHVDLVIFALPFVTLGMAILMVSQIPYPHVLNLYLRGKQPFSYLMRVLLFLGLVLWSMQTALVLIGVTFAGSGLVRWLYARVVHQGRRFLSGDEELIARSSSESEA